MSPQCPRGWLLALLSLFSAVPGVPGGPGGSLPLPVPDGRSRVLPATPGTLPELRRRFPVLALLRRRRGDRGHRPEELAALELVAQALEPSGVGLALVDTEKDPELAQEWGLAGPSRLALLRGSAVTEYRGELGAAALLQFLSQALGPPVQVVAAGQQLQDFGDIEEEPKAIGYFEGRDSEPFQAFSAAAQRFHPSLLFFATFDPQAAQELGLALNQVHLYEPFLEQPRRFWGGSGDPPGLAAFLESSKRATLRKLKAQSESESWEQQDGIHVVAFAEGDDPDGFEFLEILREVAQEQRDNPDFSVLWIDPDDFPLLVPSWEDTFDIDLSRPQLGVVNGTDHARSVWLPMGDEDDLPGPEEILEWLEAVLDGDTGDSDDDGDGEEGDEDDDEDEDDDDGNEDNEDDDNDDDDDDDDKDDDDDDNDDNDNRQ